MKEGYTWVPCSKIIQSKTLQDKDAAFEASVMESGLDDSGTRASTLDVKSLAAESVLGQFHLWKPQARAYAAGKSAPAFAKHSSDVARVLARALKK